MALTYTPKTDLGAPCPDFRLPAVDGRVFSRADFESAPVKVFMFICNHCPYVQAVEDRILALARELAPKGVAFVAICSNDSEEYPEDSLPALKERWEQKRYGFPYLHDEAQIAARAFGAVCTPDFFVFDRNFRLAYRGRLDDSWKNPAAVSRRELRDAVTSLLGGHLPAGEQNPSMGCSIKWKTER